MIPTLYRHVSPAFDLRPDGLRMINERPQKRRACAYWGFWNSSTESPNVLPVMAICILALELLERDGVWVLAGIAAFAVAMSAAGGVVIDLIKATIFITQRAFA